MTTTTALALIAVGVPGLVSLIVAFRNSSTTKQLGDRSASLEEFDKLRLALRQELDSALVRIGALEDDVAEERTKREAAEERAKEAERRADAAERRADKAGQTAIRLQKRVEHLEQVLRRNGIDPDPELV